MPKITVNIESWPLRRKFCCQDSNLRPLDLCLLWVFLLLWLCCFLEYVYLAGVGWVGGLVSNRFSTRRERHSSWFGKVDTDIGMMFPPFGITFTRTCFAYRCWSGALDIEVERCRRKASRWWFHLYTLVSTYLGQPQVSENLLPVELWQVGWSVSQGALIVFTLGSHRSVRSFCL